jgi:type III secretion system FlhB-like substrate exporter
LKPIKPAFTFKINLLTKNAPTVNGHYYTDQVFQKIINKIQGGSIIVQEYAEVERNIKKIPMGEPIPRKIMADATSAEVVGNDLIITVECKNTKIGGKLAGIIENIGLDNLLFFPIGSGTLNQRSEIQMDYDLKFIAFEPKKLK